MRTSTIIKSAIAFAAVSMILAAFLLVGRQPDKNTGFSDEGKVVTERQATDGASDEGEVAAENRATDGASDEGKVAAENRSTDWASDERKVAAKNRAKNEPRAELPAGRPDVPKASESDGAGPKQLALSSDLIPELSSNGFMTESDRQVTYVEGSALNGNGVTEVPGDFDLASNIVPATGKTTKDHDEKDEYDSPEMAYEQEIERTKDPATGKVPRERLLEALDRTLRSKSESAALAPLALSWIERGPNKDSVGPSNGNTRANNGLSSGRIRAVLVDANDPTGKTVFVGGVDGGLWKTSDVTTAPSAWTIVDDYLSNLAISDITQDPTNPNVMYFATGESYFNADAVRGNGVFKSVDGGVSWTHLPSTSSFVDGTRILCDSLGNVYLATRGTGIRRSTDGGATWSADLTPLGLPSDICDLEISSTGRLHIVTGIFSTQGYRYTDAPATVTSATWILPVTAFPSFAMRAEIAVSGNTLYALPANASFQVPTIYKSTDGGVNWAATGGQPTSGWGGGQAWYDLEVRIDPSNPNNCIVGAIDTFRTTDGGTSWSQISSWVGTSPVNQYVHADVHKIAWYDGGNKLVIASDGGIFYSSDKGLTFRDRNEDLNIKQFYSVAIHPTTTNYFLGGTQDNGTHQFSNPGLGSTVEVTGGDGAFVAIDQDQPQFQFGAFIFNQYRRSTNSGATWSSINFSSSLGRFINPFDFDNANNRLYAAYSAGQYFRWNDPQTGTSANAITIAAFNAAIVSAVTVSPNTANRVFFGTGGSGGGRIVRVDNAESAPAATNITDAAMPVNGYVSSIYVDPTSDNNLIVAFSNYGVASVWVTTNAGASWTSLDNNGVNLPDMPVRWAIFKPGDTTMAYIATETGVWETTLINGTSTVWTAPNSFPAVRTDMLEYRPGDGLIAAATHGRGLWTTPNVATPDVQFQLASGAQIEKTLGTDACRGYRDYTYNMTVLNPPTGAATVTLGVVAGGTATQNVDYQIMTPALTFADGVNKPQPFTIRIFDDASVEGAETFTLNYAISGATNAQAGAVNQTFAFTINDNDAAPVQSANLSGGVGTYTGSNLTQPFRGGFFDSRTQVLYTAAELTALGFTAGNITSVSLNVVTKASTQPYSGFTIKLKNTGTTALGFGPFETGATVVYGPTAYSTVAGANTIPITPFAWDGVSNLLVEFCFDNATATLDDLVAGATSTANTHFDRQSTNATPGCSIANSAFIFTTSSRPIITFAITTNETSFSTALASSKTAYFGPNDDVPFYDGSGNILARIKNNNAFDYGCTLVDIDRAGTSTAQFHNTNPSNYLASKSLRVIPANNTTTGNYDLTLYYTTAEVAGYDAAASPNTFAAAKLVKVFNGFFVPDVTPGMPHLSDWNVTTATVASFGTTGSTIKATYSGTGFSGFGVGNPFAPTAASVSVSGRILSQLNTGITGATINVTDSGGNVRFARSNMFGNYIFDDLQAGEFYVFQVYAKGYTFGAQSLTVNDNIRGLNFVAESGGGLGGGKNQEKK